MKTKHIQQVDNASQKAPYQAPRIETSISAKEIERELFYAGNISNPN
jgi:hypothetical protein